MKDPVFESGGVEEPYCPGGSAASALLVVFLGLGLAAVTLPLVIPTVALIGGLGIGMMGLAAGLALATLAVALKAVLVVLKLALAFSALALTLAPLVLMGLGVVYLLGQLFD